MNREVIPISKLEMNRGQVEGLPKNPRFFRDSRFEAMKKSIEDCPEMLDLRELIVYPYGDKYVVIGGFFVLAEKRYLDKEGFCKIVWMDGSIQTFIPFSKDNVRLCDCVYWHQLQNALRTFGVEKKIKL